MRASTKARWEQYQRMMHFLLEYLPSIKTRRREKIVLRRVIPRKLSENDETTEFYDFVQQDYIESLVRRFLHLPTVQQSRRELDQMVKDIQAKANK